MVFHLGRMEPAAVSLTIRSRQVFAQDADKAAGHFKGVKLECTLVTHAGAPFTSICIGSDPFPIGAVSGCVLYYRLFASLPPI